MNIRIDRLRRTRLALAVSLLLAAPAVLAQSADEDEEEERQSDALSSTEQGQTHLDESFVPSRRERIREQRRQAFEDTVYDIHLRTYYFDRDKFDDSVSKAWAGGGWAGLKTGWFRDRIAFGVTGYASFPISADDDEDGTTLLAPGQEHYEVIGELYADIKITDNMHANLGRRAYDTPYINRNDSRMTPNTFEAYTITGVSGTPETSEWRYGFGYFDKIKERNSEDFVSMSEDAGVADSDEGVFAGGANWKRGDLSIGAINYWSDDIINIFYTEAKYGFAVSDRCRINVAAQYSHESSTGDELLAGDFTTYQWGVKGEVAYGPTLFTVAYTDTGRDDNMRNPWSGYPGYTSVQVEDFNRAGEDALMLRAGFSFPKVPGLSAYALWVNGGSPAFQGQFEKQEIDFNLQYAFPEGALKGLSMRFRYAVVSQNDATDSDLEDLRFIVYYDPPGW